MTDDLMCACGRGLKQPGSRYCIDCANAHAELKRSMLPISYTTESRLRENRAAIAEAVNEARARERRYTLADYHRDVEACKSDPDWPDRRLLGATMLLPPCGCEIKGAGTIPDPIRIAFCALHKAVS